MASNLGKVSHFRPQSQELEQEHGPEHELPIARNKHADELPIDPSLLDPDGDDDTLSFGDRLLIVAVIGAVTLACSLAIWG